MPEYTDITKNHPACKSLWDFIQGEYHTRGYAFHTSWTTCSLYETDEERLLAAALDALHPDEEFHLYLEALPPLITALIVENATKLSEQTKAIKFLTDALTDLVQCNVRDSDVDLEDDEYQPKEAA
jgi:hypothetical protein